MHHIRGLIREASTPVLRALEKRTAQQASTVVHYLKDCFQQVQFIDAHGNVTVTPLVLTPKLLKLTEDLPGAEALTVLTEANNICSGSFDHLTGRVLLDLPDQQGIDRDIFYVKGLSRDTSEELQRRQILLVTRLMGRLTAAQKKTTKNDEDGFASQMNRFSEMSQTNSVTLKEVGNFRGLVQELCVVDPKWALALAVNNQICIPLTGSESHLAKMVDVSTPSAVQVFLQTFDAKDQKLPAAQTCATALAMRIRKEGAASTSGHAQNAEQEFDALQSICKQYHVDIGSVFPTDAAAIQRWASSFLSPTALPLQRREAVMSVVKGRLLAPRRVCLNALSVWCGSDLEAEWVEYSLRSPSLSSSDSCPASAASNALLHVSLDTFPLEIARRAALQLILKDPQRNLVDNHLLHLYGELLRAGDLAVEDASFSAFMDECGECHTCDHHESSSGSHRPSTVSFTTRVPLPYSSLKDDPSTKALAPSVYSILFNLAPRSSYWTALLEHRPSAFKVWTAPCRELRVEVTLPDYHECVLAEKRNKKNAEVTTCSSILSIVYEDDDLLVLNKPAGLATTRHGLSCSQSGDERMTDLVSVVITERPDPFGSLPRNGMIHRLDTDTSGCILFAKTKEAISSCRHQFGTSASFAVFSKVYLALCAVTERKWDSMPLCGTLKDPGDSKITTKYRILKFYPKSRVALVECQIQQGKKHQVRRHLATAGLPLLGDVAHGGAACAQGSIQRVALHASSMTMLHPRSAEGISFSAPIPEDFRRACALLS